MRVYSCINTFMYFHNGYCMYIWCAPLTIYLWTFRAISYIGFIFLHSETSTCYVCYKCLLDFFLNYSSIDYQSFVARDTAQSRKEYRAVPKGTGTDYGITLCRFCFPQIKFYKVDM